MRFILRALGLTLLDVELSEQEAEEALTDLGTTSSTPIGFTATPGDQRWEPCADFGYGEDD